MMEFISTSLTIAAFLLVVGGLGSAGSWLLGLWDESKPPELWINKVLGVILAAIAVGTFFGAIWTATEVKGVNCGDTHDLAKGQDREADRVVCVKVDEGD